MKFFGRFVILLAVCCFFVSGCSGVLPHSEKFFVSPWGKYQDICEVYGKVISGETKLADLKKMQIDPNETSGIEIITISDIVGIYLPNSAAEKEYLDDGVQKCLEAKNNCFGYRINLGAEEIKRKGNLFADTAGFKKITEISTWNFQGIILIAGDVVVYKERPGGKPNMKKIKTETNPLGPFNGDTSLVKRVVVGD